MRWLIHRRGLMMIARFLQLLACDSNHCLIDREVNRIFPPELIEAIDQQNFLQTDFHVLKRLVKFTV